MADAYVCRDGGLLPCRWSGKGKSVVVVPGGPGRSVDYLGDLGGLAETAARSVVMFEARGTGACPAPPHLEGYGHVSLADDLAFLCTHIDDDPLDIVAHSAGAEVALQFAARHPHRVSRLVLITPSVRSLGLEQSEDEWQRQVGKRAGEPWFDTALAALVEIDRLGANADRRRAMSPLLYGAWTESAQAHAAADSEQRNPEASALFWSGAVPVDETRRALTALSAPVRIVLGDMDLAPGPHLAGELAAMFRDAAVLTVRRAGHFPWIDAPARFARLVTRALHE